MTNTLSQAEINLTFRKIENMLKRVGKLQIEKNADKFEANYRIGRESSYLYARKKIACVGFDQNSQIEMRVEGMCSAVTLTKKQIDEIDLNLQKAVGLFKESIKRCKERHRANTINKLTEKRLYNGLKAKKVKYDHFANIKIGYVEVYVNSEKNATDIDINIKRMSLEQANKLIQLIS